MIDVENMENEVVVETAESDVTDVKLEQDAEIAETPEDGNQAEDSDKPAEVEGNFEARLAAERKKWEKELQDKTELEKLSPEEQDKIRIKQLESELRVTKLKDAAVSKLTSDEYPVELADILDYSSEDSAEVSYQKTTKAFKAALNSAMKAKIKGRTPAGLGGAAKNENNIADTVAKNIRGGF